MEYLIMANVGEPGIIQEIGILLPKVKARGPLRPSALCQAISALRSRRV